MAKPAPSNPAKEPVFLVFQGGGALGAYQAGVYEALHKGGYEPEWLAGISIGAINCAIIAGNPPEQRLPRLRQFWDRVSELVPVPWPAESGIGRRLFNETSAAITAMAGAPGFFTPRMPPPFAATPGSEAAISFYDTMPLRQTLVELVDFDLLNDGPIRVSVGAVNVLSGNLVFFDSDRIRIEPEHIMASGALPPGFPPVMIDGEPYWDGGLVSNTPLQYVLDTKQPGDAVIFQVDLFCARGDMPQTLSDVLQREKDIRYSSRTRFNTDVEKELVALRGAVARLMGKLPPEMRDDADVQFLSRCEEEGAVSVVHMINHREVFESQSKDYEFSRLTVNSHWHDGHRDAAKSISHPAWLDRVRHSSGIMTFDLAGAVGKVDAQMVV
ncbi:patatin-like phospholipase family protein [Altererythrobacter xixiisoli]|uniref:Patatin-like phospholipase family protein n=1 Tax=Croceibacterium xixiisoli TaxID=1476466 RepID=A0A6I4TWD7_9SPHN|nr:patatin-like phospholipase family protein [Croceibacterium xixiisoli]MXO98898.1 patatin-like phospholipase family protein [Croceibacterium xixiisoli]